MADLIMSINQEVLARRLSSESQVNPGDRAYAWWNGFLRALVEQGVGFDYDGEPTSLYRYFQRRRDEIDAAWGVALDLERAEGQRRYDALKAVFLKEPEDG